MKKRYCINCGKKLEPPFRNPKQRYCNARECQNTRRRLTQNKKMLSDPEYKANQKQARSAWYDRNPDYYKKYRFKNKDYTERNRIQQRERNKRRRAAFKAANASPVAKKYASETINAINSGKYKLIPISDNDPMIAKMDAFIVQLIVINENYDVPSL